MAAETVQSDAVKSDVMPDHSVPAGIVLSRTGTYVATAELDANSVLEMVPIPAGAQVLDIILKTSALGAGRTIDVGDGGDIDRFVDGGDASGAAVFRLSAAAGLNHEYAADDTIDIKVLGDTFPDEATATVIVFYKMEGGIADET